MSDEKETVVVSNTGGNGGAWFLGIVVAIGIVVVAFLAYNGFFTGGDSVEVELKVPEISAPAQ
ncbi:hypothetical protein [Mariluticola halotolerans]|uniref:hypothetical protein n=1 Tax=Mariluticola halotolerans TaxID=2909283 RepID=UPI0026E33338|nr:hypothetical protein [Mariluticola halotolerans]UJQ94512.1 hypothetical protein L1P08_00515 [Mariluticola halotolerans]